MQINGTLSSSLNLYRNHNIRDYRFIHILLKKKNEKLSSINNSIVIINKVVLELY